MTPIASSEAVYGWVAGLVVPMLNQMWIVGVGTIVVGVVLIWVFRALLRLMGRW